MGKSVFFFRTTPRFFLEVHQVNYPAAQMFFLNENFAHTHTHTHTHTHAHTHTSHFSGCINFMSVLLTKIINMKENDKPTLWFPLILLGVKISRYSKKSA